MNLLLDTCGLLALAAGSLPKSARKHLMDADEVIVSPILVWEIAIKLKTGKLQLPVSPQEWIEALVSRHSLTLDRRFPDIAILCAAAELPLIHRDPFDRVLIATALEYKLAILTTDRIIPSYPNVMTVW